MQDTTNPVGEGIIYKLWNKAIAQVSTGDLTGQVTTLEKLVNLDDSLGYKNGELVLPCMSCFKLNRLGILDKFQKAALKKASKDKSFKSLSRLYIRYYPPSIY